MAAATAFFTTFALPPIIIIFTQFFRFWVDPGVLSSELISRLGHILGRGSARQVEGVLEAVSGLNQSWYGTVFGFIFLMFVATTLFDVIKNFQHPLSYAFAYYNFSCRIFVFGCIVFGRITGDFGKLSWRNPGWRQKIFLLPDQ
jgi:hypothetical protein